MHAATADTKKQTDFDSKGVVSRTTGRSFTSILKRPGENNRLSIKSKGGNER